VGTAKETGISTGSCHGILMEDLTKFVPRLLIDDQRIYHVCICKVFLQHANGD
jgi:hypothetical protein